MGLRRKFNLVLLVVFLLGLTVTGYVSWDLSSGTRERTSSATPTS